ARSGSPAKGPARGWSKALRVLLAGPLLSGGESKAAANPRRWWGAATATPGGADRAHRWSSRAGRIEVAAEELLRGLVFFSLDRAAAGSGWRRRARSGDAHQAALSPVELAEEMQPAAEVARRRAGYSAPPCSACTRGGRLAELV
ncbi:unnamed protein product, partial [Urochloa humidicola]